MKIHSFTTRLENFEITINSHSIFLKLSYEDNQEGIPEDTFEILSPSNSTPEKLANDLQGRLSSAKEDKREIVVEIRDNYLSLDNLGLICSFFIKR